jgi:hypothetical protein
MEALNVQSGHRPKVVCVFTTAATLLNVIKTFKNAGVLLARDEGVLRRHINPERARCLLVPLTRSVFKLSDEDEDLEGELYKEHCAIAVCVERRGADTLTTHVISSRKFD